MRLFFHGVRAIVFLLLGLLFCSSFAGYAATNMDDTERDERMLSMTRAEQDVAQLTPAPNGYGLFRESNDSFYRLVVTKIYEGAIDKRTNAGQIEGTGGKGDNTPFSIYEGGFGNASFLRAILRDPRNNENPIHYIGGELNPDCHSFLSKAKREDSKNSSNMIQKASPGDISAFLNGINPDSFDAELFFLSLHFIPPWKLVEALSKIWVTVKPGGLVAGAMKITNESDRKKLSQESLWPYFYLYVDPQFPDQEFQVIGDMLKPGYSFGKLFINSFLAQELRDLLEAFGFTIKICEENKGYAQKVKGELFKSSYLAFMVTKEPSHQTKHCYERREQYIAEAQAIEKALKERMNKHNIPIPAHW